MDNMPPTDSLRKQKIRHRIQLAVTGCVGCLLFIAFAVAILHLRKFSYSSGDPQHESLFSPREPKIINPENPQSKPNTQSASQICTTRGCVQTAHRLISTLDESVDPCTDFYKFSCGKFLKESLIPDDKSALYQYSILQDELLQKLGGILRKPILKRDAHCVRFAKNLYHNCMNETKIANEGLQPLKDVMNTLGNPPVLEGTSWDASNKFSWVQFVNRSRQLGLPTSYLFSISVEPDLSNSSSRIIHIDQPSFGLAQDFLLKGLNDTKVEGYLNYAIQVVKLLGANETFARSEMKDVLQFEMKLANNSLSKEQRRDYAKLNNRFSSINLSKTVPDIPWLDYIRIHLPDSMKVDGNEIVIAVDFDFIKNLPKLLNQTPKRVIANYLSWRVVKYSAEYLSDDLRKLEQEYQKVLSGRKEREPRWKECVKFSRKGAPFAIGMMYINEFFDEASKKKSDELFLFIQKEFEKMLRTNDWMEERTRKAALEKAMAMTSSIAYPVELLSKEIVDDYYKNISENSFTYLNSSMQIYKFDIDNAWSDLRKPVNKTDWRDYGDVAIINGFYSNQKNAIRIPAGILQGNFFNANGQRLENYAAMGFIMAHEMTHGFDDTGKQFDKVGNLMNWWQGTTESKFKHKANCIIWQYGNYTAENGMNLNGILGQGENIADNGGLEVAYLAYKAAIKEYGADLKLPGLLAYTPEQLFWIAFSQTFCSLYRPETLEFIMNTWSHSLHNFRVIGSLSNRPEFSKDWKCSPGSYMNPVNKCQIW